MSNRLSVALATYNGERYLGEQLESILRQTRLPDELVIFDDASTDSTPAIVQEFAKAAPFPVRFQINAERLGSTRNFEAAIRACSGDIIFLCDQDDVWYPDKIARMEERFIKDPEAGAVFTDADLTYANFEGANCYAVDFNNTKLHRTNFANANVSEASMMGVKDMYGVTVTMECKSFQRLRLDPGWWWGWLFYPLLMSPPKTATFDPERDKDALKLLMGADRWEVLRRQYANREM